MALLAYLMGATGGCGTASNLVKRGTMSAEKRIKAPLLPIWSLERERERGREGVGGREKIVYEAALEKQS